MPIQGRQVDVEVNEIKPLFAIVEVNRTGKI